MTSAPLHYSLAIGRVIPAPIDAVFDAWLDPVVMQHWLKPRAEVMTTVRATPTVGGKFNVVMRSSNQEELHDGTYTLIDRPNRLRLTWSSASAGPGTIIDVSFLASTDGATMLLLKHAGLKSRAAEDNHREGWRRILDRLADTLKRPA